MSDIKPLEDLQPADPDRDIDEGDYNLTQQQVMTLAAVLRELPLKAMLEKIDHADTLGPFMNPTLWTVGESKMRIVRKTCAALYKAQKALPDLQEFLEAEERTQAAARMAGVDPETGR